jgi:hypothetical protein
VKCDEGSSLVGNDTSICGVDGKWDGKLGECAKGAVDIASIYPLHTVCKRDVTVEHASITYPKAEILLSNSEMTIKCDAVRVVRTGECEELAQGYAQEHADTAVCSEGAWVYKTLDKVTQKTVCMAGAAQ